MFETRMLERYLFPNPELNSHDVTLFPMVAEDELDRMENVFLSNTDSIYVFMYTHTSTLVPYVEVYIWDILLHPEYFHRFVISDGYMMPIWEENLYNSYLADSKIKLLIPPKMMESVSTIICDRFPKWHYYMYLPEEVKNALIHLYYASFRSGAREILYKANLNYIATMVDLVPNYNVVGTTPEKIINHMLPLKLLRVLNQAPYIHCMESEKQMAEACQVYRRFCNCIGKDDLSVAQFTYLNLLSDKESYFGGKNFSHTLFNRLKGVQSAHLTYTYERFFELKRDLSKLLPSLKLPRRLPQAGRISRLVNCLEQIMENYRYGSEDSRDIAFRALEEADLYEYSHPSSEYFVRLPKDSIEIFLESFSQRNCLADYIDDHADGNTTILFLRKKQKPNTAFVTVEVNNHRQISQVYAHDNTYPEVFVYRFLENYAKDKDFTYDPEKLISVNDRNNDAVDENPNDPQLIEYLKNYWSYDAIVRFPGTEDDIRLYTQLSIDMLYPTLLIS